MKRFRRKKKPKPPKPQGDPYDDKTWTSAALLTDGEDSRGSYTDSLSDVTEHDPGSRVPIFKRAITVFTEFACTGSTSLNRQPDDQIVVNRMARARFRKMSAELKETWRDIRWTSLYLTFLIVLSCGLITIGQLFAVTYEIAHVYGEKSVCVYEWASWSQCSAPCRNGSIPYRIRGVKPFSILDLTSIYKYDDIFVKIVKIWRQFNSNANCNANFQYAPCNVLKCPVELSSLEYGDCEYGNIPKNIQKKEQCRRFLKVEKNTLVHIDNATIDLSVTCNCSAAIYPF